MAGSTYRLICLWFCLLFGLVWLWLSIKAGGMYVPPAEVQSFLGLLLAGKFAQTIKG